MKRFDLFFVFIQLPIDYAMLVLAGVSAYAIRFSGIVTRLRPVQFASKLSFTHYFPILFWVALGWIVIFAVSGLYHINPNRKFAGDLTRVITACSTGFAAITIYVFFTLQKFDSRFLVLASWILAMVCVLLGRFAVRGIKALLYRFGIGLSRTIVIGQAPVADIITKTLISRPQLGCKIVGTEEHFSADAPALILKQRPDEIIFTDPKAHEADAIRAIDFANEHHLVFKYSADLFATISSNMSISTIAGIPIIELRRTRLTGWGRIVKRLIDFILALIFLIILSPLFLLIAVVVLIETGRPVIYKNTRVGQNGEEFITLKFRSMYQKYCTGPQFGKNGGAAALKTEAELIKKQNSKTGPVYKIKNDPRITPWGGFLRRWSLDELPQLWNVIKGEMSLVGPRPHQPREVNNYQKQHRIVLAIKPGISGLAQISGRSDLAFEDEVKLDTFYIENWSLYLDLIILIKTPFIVLKRKGAW